MIKLKKLEVVASSQKETDGGGCWDGFFWFSTLCTNKLHIKKYYLRKEKLNL